MQKCEKDKIGGYLWSCPVIYDTQFKKKKKKIGGYSISVQKSTMPLFK